MFGELALIYNQPRLATVIALNSSEMCVLDKRNFKKILGTSQRLEDQKKNEFIEKEILKDKEYAPLAHVIGVNFVKRHAQRNKILFSEGDLPEKVYLVYSGQVRLWRQVEAREGEKESSTQVRDQVKLNSLIRTRKTKPSKRELCLMTGGQMIGEEGLFSGHRRTYTAVIDDESILYEIDNERFLVVCKKNKPVQQMMEKLIQKKLSHLKLLEIRAENLHENLQRKMIEPYRGNKPLAAAFKPLQHDPTKQGTTDSEEPSINPTMINTFESCVTEEGRSRNLSLQATANLKKLLQRDENSTAHVDNMTAVLKKQISSSELRSSDNNQSPPLLLFDQHSQAYLRQAKQKDAKTYKKLPTNFSDRSEVLIGALLKPRGINYQNLRSNVDVLKKQPILITSDPHAFRMELAVRRHRRQNTDSLVFQRSRTDRFVSSLQFEPQTAGIMQQAAEKKSVSVSKKSTVYALSKPFDQATQSTKLMTKQNTTTGRFGGGCSEHKSSENSSLKALESIPMLEVRSYSLPKLNNY